MKFYTESGRVGPSVISLGTPRAYARLVFVLLAVALLVAGSVAAQPLPGGTLDPTTVPKYVDKLVIPPVMPPTNPNLVVRGCKNVQYYEIATRQFQQQILPSSGFGISGTNPFPKTTVWGYGSVNHPGTFNAPSFTLEATVDKPVRVKWINQLVDGKGKFLPHLLPVDQTIHWANPPGGKLGRDSHGTNQDPYTGPVPLVTHLHGGHVTQESDGYPEAWFLPNAKNIPSGFATTGTFYDKYKQSSSLGNLWEPGTAVFEYPNTQNASTVWYHDHALGMTRLNVYAGPAGFYLVRGGSSDVNGNELPGPAPALGDPPGKKYYEIPIAIQDRSFNDDGSLFYPSSRAFFEGLEPDQLQIPFTPDQACSGPSDVAPIANPEFFANTMMVNGKTWPVLNVEPRRYRFRFLNGCDSRTIILKIATDPLATRPATPALPFWQIGGDGGFLPEPVKLDQLLISLAERADCIVDFSKIPVGTELFLINEGPDSPYNGSPVTAANASDPGTTGQVMKFKVVPLVSKDKSKPPNKLKLPNIKRLGSANRSRNVSLNELDSQTVLVSTENGNVVLDCANGVPFGPVTTLLGTVNPNGTGLPLLWDDAITEKPRLNDTEIWAIHNFTVDGHPIHLHLVTFEVVDRRNIGDVVGGPTTTPPQPWETGFKDTILALPGQITRIKAKFDTAGRYVWHCHIISHEDNEMMRPFIVTP